MDIRSAFQHLGSVRPLALALVYALCAFLVTAVSMLVGGSIPGSVVVRILALVLLVLLFIVVTWFRSDDWLAAGVLITLTVYAASAVQGMLVVIFRGGIGPAALWGAVTAGGAIIYAIILAPVVGGVVALARKLTRSLEPLPNTR